MILNDYGKRKIVSEEQMSTFPNILNLMNNLKILELRKKLFKFELKSCLLY
jgi:hypothetical protein